MSDLCVSAAGLGKKFPVRDGRKSVVGWIEHAFRGKRAEERWIFRGLSFDLRRGERVALKGGNGAGKTTLLRLIAGIYRPSEGTLRVADPPATLFRFWASLVRDLTVEESVHVQGVTQGVDWRTLDDRLDAILDAAGLDGRRHEPVRNLSAGQTQSLALSIFLHTPRRFFVFDESFVHLDAKAAVRCLSLFEAILKPGRTILMASHDPVLLRRFCDRAVVLESGSLRDLGTPGTSD